MKNILLRALVGVFVSVGASAEVIKCVFTEPFVTTQYSTARQTLTISELGEKPVVIKNVSFRVKAPQLFELQDKSGNVLQTLELNYKGNDGMRDTLYPYDVHQGDQQGGCASDKYPLIRK